MRPLNWGCRSWRRDDRADLTRALRPQLDEHSGRGIKVRDADGVGSGAERRRDRGLRPVVDAEQGGDRAEHAEEPVGIGEHGPCRVRARTQAQLERLRTRVQCRAFPACLMLVAAQLLHPLRGIRRHRLRLLVCRIKLGMVAGAGGHALLELFLLACARAAPACACAAAADSRPTSSPAASA